MFLKTYRKLLQSQNQCFAKHPEEFRSLSSAIGASGWIRVLAIFSALPARSRIKRPFYAMAARRAIAPANVINVSLMAGNYTGGATVIRKHSCANISPKSSGAGRLYHRSQTQTLPVRELAAPVNYYSIDLPDPHRSSRARARARVYAASC